MPPEGVNPVTQTVPLNGTILVDGDTWYQNLGPQVLFSPLDYAVHAIGWRQMKDWECVNLLESWLRVGSLN